MSQVLVFVLDVGECCVVLFFGMCGVIVCIMSVVWQVLCVVQLIEVDVIWLEVVVQVLQQQFGLQCKVMLMVFVLCVVVLILCEYLCLNVCLQEKEIELMFEVNIGLVVSLDEGLMVLVLCNVDMQLVVDIVVESCCLVVGVCVGMLLVGSYQYGIFIVMNFGMMGIDSFMFIINVLQVVIFGVMCVVKWVVVKDDSIVIVLMMGLYLIFDYCVVDGYLVVCFLIDLKMWLEIFEGL